MHKVRWSVKCVHLRKKRERKKIRWQEKRENLVAVLGKGGRERYNGPGMIDMFDKPFDPRVYDLSTLVESNVKSKPMEFWIKIHASLEIFRKTFGYISSSEL